MTNVLLTCAGRRHYLVTFFRQALKGRGRVIGADMDPTAPALAACDRSYRVPPVFSEGYLDRIIEIILAEDVRLVFSLSDLEVGLLAEQRSRIEDGTGAVIYAPALEAMRVCSDKYSTFTFASQIGVPTPATFLDPDQASLAIALGQVGFPLIVKPRWGSGSIGLHRVTTEAELVASFAACETEVANSSLAPLGLSDPIIVQEAIEGPEYGVDLLYGLDERLIGFAAKRKLAMRAGETDKAVTVRPEPFQHVVEQIARHLPHRGNLDCDFLERNGQLHLLELNPRFGGGYPFTHMAGADHVTMLLNDFLGVPLPDYGYATGLAFAKCDMLVRVPDG